MPPNQRDGRRDEFEIAYYTKELGPQLQRQLLKQRLADFSDSRSPGAQPAETPDPPAEPHPPEPDRAG